MSYTKVIIILVAVLAFFSALIAIACLGLMSAEDYATREQVAYESLEEPQDYDPDKFALDANRG